MLTLFKTFLILYLMFKLVKYLINWGERRRERERREDKKRQEEKRAIELEAEEKAERLEDIERENIRLKIRAKDEHQEPHSYSCYGHPNRTLALRYGVLNQTTDNKGNFIENDSIRIKKNGVVKNFRERSHFIAELVDFDNRVVRVIIDENDEFIKTFYPIKEREWFNKYESLERVLKESESFTLKELAKYHLDVVVIPNIHKIKDPIDPVNNSV